MASIYEETKDLFIASFGKIFINYSLLLLLLPLDLLLLLGLGDLLPLPPWYTSLHLLSLSPTSKKYITVRHK